MPGLPRPSVEMLNAKEAAAWLGLTVNEFRSEVERYPLHLPYTEIGNGRKWSADDLAVYRYLRLHGRCGAPAQSPRKPRHRPKTDED